MSDPEERYELGPEAGELSSSRIFAGAVRATGAPVFVQKLARSDEELAALAPALEKGARALSDAGVPGRPVEWDVAARPGWIVYDHHGEPLAKAVRRGRDPGLVDSVAIETAVALEVLSKVGLTHRAINPGTLFHQNRRIAVLGLDALRASYDTARADRVPPNDPRYTAPEAFDGGGDIKADVYSLGCVLFALMTGAPPYFGSAAALREAHRSEPIPTVPGTDALGWNELLVRMLAKQPGARPQPHEIAGLVRKARARIHVVAAAPVVLPLKRERGRGPLVMVVAALMLALAGGAAAMTMLAPKAPTASPAASTPPVAGASAPVAAVAPTAATAEATPEPTQEPGAAPTPARTNAPGAIVAPRPTVARTPAPTPPPITQVTPAAGPRGTIFRFAIGGFPAGAVFVQSYSDTSGFQSNPISSGVVGADGVARTTLGTDVRMITGPYALRVTAGGVSRVVTFQITP